MRKMRDGRNPYGSRGGYIVNRSPRRDRAESEEDYARNNGTGYRDYANMNREYEDGRQGVKGTGRYGIGGSSYYGRDRANNEYDYNYGENYTRNNARDYGYGYGMFDYDIEDYAMWRDYASESMGKLTSKDIRKWERHLENADGTTGKKYEVDQIRQVAQQMGIHFDEYSPELLTAITNMMYMPAAQLPSMTRKPLSYMKHIQGLFILIFQIQLL